MRPCEKMLYTDTDIAATKAALNAIYGTSPVFVIGNNECDTTPIVPKIERVIYNNPATVVYWSDGSKTVVKCQDGDVWDSEKGLALCIAKKACGNDNTYNKMMAPHLPETDAYTSFGIGFSVMASSFGTIVSDSLNGVIAQIKPVLDSLSDEQKLELLGEMKASEEK